MAKDIFSKIIKDYNNELEAILEKKDFDSNVKSLLLSMLYKIENGYEDYKKVKVNVCTKKQFVKEILETIEKRCNKIELIKPTSEEGQELYEKNINCIIDKENGTIKTFQNEKSMLDAIMLMRQEEIELLPKYELIAEPIIDTLLVGNSINSLELITDFNGWSWDITSRTPKSTIYSKLYQLVIILIGNKQIDSWINNRQEETEELPSNVILSSKYNESFGITKKEIIGEKQDYIKEIEEIFINLYGEELSKDFFEKFIKVAMLECSSYNKQYEKKIISERKKIKDELAKMSDNKTFIEELSSQKKEITKQIEQIDKLLSNEKELRNEYEKRNKKLPNKEKIFSVSHLKLMLEKRRNTSLEEIKIINKNMEPQEFIKIKQKLEEKLEFYNSIKIEEKTKQNLERLQKDLEETFIKCFNIKIENAIENKQIENLIYELRYYKLLQPILIDETSQIENKLIKKACEQKILTKFSEVEQTNYQILKEIFISKIIDLDTIIFLLKYTKGTLTLNIFDGNTHDETKQITITEKTELSVKLNKKIKIWG